MSKTLINDAASLGRSRDREALKAAANPNDRNRLHQEGSKTTGSGCRGMRKLPRLQRSRPISTDLGDAFCKHRRKWLSVDREEKDDRNGETAEEEDKAGDKRQT